MRPEVMVHRYSATDYSYLGRLPNVKSAKLLLGSKFKHIYMYSRGVIIDGVIYCLTPCPYSEYEDMARYFDVGVGEYLSKRDVAIRDKGVPIYVYEYSSKQFIKKFDSIDSASEGMDVPFPTLVVSTRKKPLGYKRGDLLFCRIPLIEDGEVDV